MALLQVHFSSRVLQRRVPMWVILPVDRKYNHTDEEMSRKGDFKTLYLMNGFSEDCAEWVTSTRIKRWAEERNLAVVMPSGENAFYVDNPLRGDLYGEFIGRELVDITRDMFHLSGKREDTFIGGLSMGGFGALLNGMEYSDTFGAITAFSSGLALDPDMPIPENGPMGKVYFKSIFGDLEEAAKGSNNPDFHVDRLIAQGKEIPKIYFSCGTEDPLLKCNRNFHKFLSERNVEHTYYEGPGNHDWYFWDQEILKAMNWLLA